jgi:hypothetical protein
MQGKNRRNLAKFVIILLGIFIPSFIFFGFWKGSIYAATSDTVNLQGKIVRNDTGHEGLNVTTGSPTCVVSGSGNDTCDFRIRYYDASSGGNLLLTEEFSNVEIGEYLGVFNLSLGSDISPTAGVYSSFSGLVQGEDDVYVEMGFDPAGSNIYTEVFTRMPLEATAYAIRAKYADTATGATEVPWSGLQDPTEDLTIEHSTRKTLFNWATGTGTDDLFTLTSSASATGTGALMIVQTRAGATLKPLRVRAGTIEGLMVNNQGRVGIGTTAPRSELEVVGSITLDDEVMSVTDVTFDGDTSAGLKLTNPRGYITLTPLNTGWAHIYTDRNNFIFNKPVYSIVNTFSSYNADLLLQRVGVTEITVGSTLTTITDNLSVNGAGGNYFAGNVGIGTTPSYKLDVSGGTGIVGRFSGRVIGADAVNTNEFVTKSQLDTVAGADTSFADLTSGTNTSAAMVVGAGASLVYNGGTAYSGGINSNYLLGSTWAVPGAIGSTTPNTGAFTTLSASTSLTTPLVIGTSNSLTLRPTTNAVNAIRLANAAGTAILSVDTTNSRVGIGTTSPSTQLHTTGGVRFAGITTGTQTTAVMADTNGNLSTRALGDLAFEDSVAGDNWGSGFWTLAGDTGTQTINQDETATVAGGTGITTLAEATRKVTVSLDNTAVTPGSYGSSIQVGTFTVDQQGRLTAAGNTTIRDASGTQSGVVSTGTQTFAGTKTFSGALTTNAGITNNHITLATRMASTASSATQIPVFIADPSSTTRTLVTRTPAELRSDIGAGTGDGTVTSVGLSMPTQFSVTNSPVTSSGTLTAQWVSHAANSILAGPTSGVDAIPTFRALVNEDIPSALTGKTYNGLSVSTGTDTFTLTRGSSTLARSGAHALTLTTTGLVNATFPVGTYTLATTGDLHPAVTLAGNNYLTLSGQEITAGNINLASHVTGTLGVASGGTGIASYTAGDIIYASGTTTLAKRTIGTAGQVLTVSAGLPVWTDVSSITEDNYVDSLDFNTSTGDLTVGRPGILPDLVESLDGRYGLASSLYGNWVIKDSSGDTGATVGSGEDVQFLNGTNITTTRSSRNVTFATVTNPTFSTSVTTPLVIGTSNSLTLRPTTNAVNAIRLANAGGIAILSVDTTNSRVGIGTTSPSTQLHTTGGVRFAGITTGTQTTAVMADTNGNLSTRALGDLAFASSLAFLDLSDVTETTYTGSGGQLVAVNAGATGLEFVSSVPASSVPFSGITSGTNTSAAMVVGAGASLNYTGTGTINASDSAALQVVHGQCQEP